MIEPRCCPLQRLSCELRRTRRAPERGTCRPSARPGAHQAAAAAGRVAPRGPGGRLKTWRSCWRPLPCTVRSRPRPTRPVAAGGKAVRNMERSPLSSWSPLERWRPLEAVSGVPGASRNLAAYRLPGFTISSRWVAVGGLGQRRPFSATARGAAVRQVRRPFAPLRARRKDAVVDAGEEGSRHRSRPSGRSSADCRWTRRRGGGGSYTVSSVGAENLGPDRAPRAPCRDRPRFRPGRRQGNVPGGS